MPSAEPEVWRKDVRRAKDRIGPGQVLIVSVVGTWAPGMDTEQLVQDYARCAAWAAEAGGDAIEVHLAVPDPFAEQPQLIYENIPLAAQILYRVRTTMPKPVLAKVGVFRTPRILHETATKLASWASGFVMTHGVRRRVVDEEGNAAFEGAGRDRATIVGAEDRKSTRLNSSHLVISYAVFCLKKKKKSQRHEDNAEVCAGLNRASLR